MAQPSLPVQELKERARSAPVPRTPRLSFGEMSASDLDDMAELLGDPEVMRHYPRPKTREEARGWIRWNERLYENVGFGLWLIRLAGSGEFVGDCGLTIQHVQGRDEIEVGYHVRRELWCRGLATEGAAACRDYAGDVLGVSRLVAIIHPRNVASQRIAEKIGMRPEAEVVHANRPAVLFAMRPSTNPPS